MMGTVDATADKGGVQDEQVFLTLRVAARRYSVSYDLIHAAVLNGELPFERPSREYLVEPAEVRAWIRRRTEERAS